MLTNVAACTRRQLRHCCLPYNLTILCCNGRNNGGEQRQLEARCAYHLQVGVQGVCEPGRDCSWVKCERRLSSRV